MNKPTKSKLITLQQMTLQEALTILTTYHAWRIDDDEAHIQKPSEITKAIETVLNHHNDDTSSKKLV
jgi:hypothetical protein